MNPICVTCGTQFGDAEHALSDCPIFQDERQYVGLRGRTVMRPDPSLVFWAGEAKALAGGLTLIRCGGHFAGGTVLHVPGRGDGKGALLSGSKPRRSGELRPQSSRSRSIASTAPFRR